MDFCSSSAQQVSLIIFSTGSALCCSAARLLGRLEARAPQRPAIGITLRLAAEFQPDGGELRAFLLAHGFSMATGAISINYSYDRAEWRFVAIALCRRCGSPLIEFSQYLAKHAGLVHARN
jgi:putative Mg2+ transporter-C (MgtC) family protein